MLHFWFTLPILKKSPYLASNDQSSLYILILSKDFAHFIEKILCFFFSLDPHDNTAIHVFAMGPGKDR